MTRIALKACNCGFAPKMRCVRVAEDAEECWVECSACGQKTEEIEDAYCDFATAAWQWDRGDRVLARTPAADRAEHEGLYLSTPSTSDNTKETT